MELCCTRTSVSEHISRQIVSCLLSLKSTLCRANGTTILEEWDNGKRVEAKKETITNEEEEEVQELSIKYFDHLSEETVMKKKLFRYVILKFS